MPTGLGVADLIHDRATLIWNSTNSSSCNVDQIRIKYREVGTTSWSQKNMGSPAGSPSGPSCNVGNNEKIVLNLNPSTQYEWYMKVWYCNAPTTGWSAMQYFTTLDACPNVSNFSVTTPTTTKATFTWNTPGVYEFVRIKLRIDSVANPSSSDWQSAGGFGVFYPTNSTNKNGLTPGQTYRAQARTWCNPSGGPYRADNWTSLVFWSQPNSIRLGEQNSIANLDVYPNPSTGIFNISFNSEKPQNIKLHVKNILGEEIMSKTLIQYVGEYTHKIDLANKAKGIYLMQIETNNQIINTKLILE